MTNAEPGYQPNPLRPLAVVVAAVGALALAVVVAGFLRAEPFVPAAVQQAGVVVREFDLSRRAVAGPPRSTFPVLVDVVPAAVLDVDDVDFRGRTFLAAWYDESGAPWLAVQGRTREQFDGAPVLPTSVPIEAPGRLTFVFGTWGRGERRYTQVYARTEVLLVARR